MANNAAVEKFRVGNVIGNVWKNSGDNGDWFSVTLERTYKDDDVLQNTNNLNHGDLLKAAKCLERAEAFIAEQ